jgi:ABC-type multidrug transport system fused ATPase/permease subunit
LKTKKSFIKNLNLIFSKNYLFSLILIFIFIVISTILESLSISLVFPIVLSVINEETNSSYFIFNFLYTHLNFLKIQNKIVFFIILFAFVYLLKIFLLIFFFWYKNKFAWDVHNDISSRVYTKYLEQNIDFFKKTNSGKIIRDFTTEIPIFIGNGIIPAINIIANSFILLGFLIIFLILNFQITLFLTAVIAILSFLFNFSNKFLLKKLGLTRQINEGLRISYLNQGINSIKEAKIYAKEKWFLQKFNKYNQITFDSLRSYDFIRALPRFFLEIVLLIFVASIVIIFFKKQSLNELLPFFGVMLVAFYRALPILSQLIVSLQSLNFSKSAYQLILNSLSLKSINEISDKNYVPLEFKKSIEIKNIKVFYNNPNKTVLNNISLKISKGDCVGIIGKSGVGKSTLLDTLMGLIKPNAGNILVDGKSIYKNLRSWQKLIGYVPQSIYLIDDSIAKNIAFGENEQDINIINLINCAKDAEIFDLINNLPKKEKSLVGEKGSKLSGGEKQRIAIARSLYISPEIIIFDEATSSLDAQTEKKIVDSIKKLSKNKTVIIVSHRISSLNICNKIYEMKDGKIYLNK